MKCPNCNEHMVNVGVPGEENYLCFEGCTNLTEVLPVIGLKDFDNEKEIS